MSSQSAPNRSTARSLSGRHYAHDLLLYEEARDLSTHISSATSDLKSALATVATHVGNSADGRTKCVRALSEAHSLMQKALELLKVAGEEATLDASVCETRMARYDVNLRNRSMVPTIKQEQEAENMGASPYPDLNRLQITDGELTSLSGKEGAEQFQGYPPNDIPLTTYAAADDYFASLSYREFREEEDERRNQVAYSPSIEFTPLAEAQRPRTLPSLFSSGNHGGFTPSADQLGSYDATSWRWCARETDSDFSNAGFASRY